MRVEGVDGERNERKSPGKNLVKSLQQDVKHLELYKRIC